MKKTMKQVKRVVVALIGFPLLVIGLILIPLPGPGLLVVLAALALLSTEFEWARKYVQMVREKLNNVYELAKKRANEFEEKHDQDKKDKKSSK